VVPEAKYSYIDLQKEPIVQEIKGKSGVYR
jgi:hypothetical protein